jgi:hypothetical protein
MILLKSTHGKNTQATITGIVTFAVPLATMIHILSV